MGFLLKRADVGQSNDALMSTMSPEVQNLVQARLSKLDALYNSGRIDDQMYQSYRNAIIARNASSPVMHYRPSHEKYGPVTGYTQGPDPVRAAAAERKRRKLKRKGAATPAAPAPTSSALGAPAPTAPARPIGRGVLEATMPMYDALSTTTPAPKPATSSIVSPEAMRAVDGMINRKPTPAPAPAPVEAPVAAPAPAPAPTPKKPSKYSAENGYYSVDSGDLYRGSKMHFDEGTNKLTIVGKKRADGKRSRMTIDVDPNDTSNPHYGAYLAAKKAAEPKPATEKVAPPSK